MAIMKKPQDQALSIAYSIQKRNKKKKMASGGKVEREDDLIIEPASDEEAGEKPLEIEEVSDEEIKPMMKKKKMFAEGGVAREYGKKPEMREHPSPSPRKPDDKRLPEEEYMADHFDDADSVEPRKHSVADRIISKKKFAEGGQVDLAQNAEEDANLEDQLSFEALKKENYSESEGLDALDQPEDSNMHDVKLEDADEHDMVDIIRRKILAKRSR
jgi:hypothetical protein